MQTLVGLNSTALNPVRLTLVSILGFVKPPLSVLSTPVLLDGLESTTGWTGVATASITAVPALVQGTNALSVIGNGTSTPPNITKVGLKTNTQYSDLGVVAMCFATRTDDLDAQAVASVDYRFGRSGTYNTIAGVTNQGTLNSSTYTNYGKFWHAFHVSEVSALPTGAGSIDLRVQLNQAAPYVTQATLDGVITNAKGRPTVLLTFDDARPSQYTEAFQYMQSKGIKGTVYVPTGLVGGTNRLTLAQLQEMDRAGWDMALNGTPDDTPMTTKYASPTAAVTGLAADQAWLVANGLNPRAKDHICYPNGTYQVAGTTINLTNIGITVNSNVVTLASTAGITIGMKFICYAFPTGTTVTAVNAGNITVSSNSTETSSTRAAKCVDASGPFHIGKLQAALRSAGFKTARTTTSGGDASPFFSRFGIGDRGMLLPGQGVTSMTLSQMQAYVNKARLRGSTHLFYFHDITPAGGGINISIANFRALIDYILSFGDVEVLTLSEWWARDCANPTVPV